MAKTGGMCANEFAPTTLPAGDNPCRCELIRTRASRFLNRVAVRQTTCRELPASSASGFTLLEVLIATTLLGLMMLVLMGSLRIGAASWDAGEKRMAEAERLYTVHNFLRWHIGTALPLTGLVPDGRTMFLFQGGSDFLEYVAPLPSQVKSGGLYRFRLYVAEDEEQRQSLRLTILPYASSRQQTGVASSGTQAEEEVIDDLEIMENLGELKLSYLARNQTLGRQQEGQQPSTWEEEWSEPVLPALVRIELSPAGENPWPILLVAPKIQRIR